MLHRQEFERGMLVQKVSCGVAWRLFAPRCSRCLKRCEWGNEQSVRQVVVFADLSNDPIRRPFSVSPKVEGVALEIWGGSSFWRCGWEHLVLDLGFWAGPPQPIVRLVPPARPLQEPFCNWRPFRPITDLCLQESSGKHILMSSHIRLQETCHRH